MNYRKVFTNGLLKENPVLVMLLGTCPTLATTNTVSSAIGMGLATTFVLLCSNVVISLVKKVIPKEVRLPCYITIIAGFVTLVSFVLQKFVPSLYTALGVFLSLIVVNCIILGRAEMFASKNNAGASALDGLGMGVGFTLALIVISTIREVLGCGTFMGAQILGAWYEPMIFFITPAGGFFVFGMIIAIVNAILRRQNRKPKESFGCENCPSKASCENAGKGECKA